MGTTPNKGTAAAASTCTCSANHYGTKCETECKDAKHKKVNSAKTACECKDTYWKAMTSEDVCTNDCTTDLTGYKKDGSKCVCDTNYAVKDGKCVKCSDNDANSEPKADASACVCKTNYIQGVSKCV